MGKLVTGRHHSSAPTSGIPHWPVHHKGITRKFQTILLHHADLEYNNNHFVFSLHCFFRMAVDIYDSQYLLILAPSLVIALMFLFFWLFMKETSYDEVLAKQKRDLKLPPSKPDTRKKSEKKKSKKKESASGSGGGGGGGGGGADSEEDLKDFDVTDGGDAPALEVEEEPQTVVARKEAPLTSSAYVPVSVTPETPSGLRARKKKEKKAARAAAAAAAAAAGTATATASAAATEAAAANDSTSKEAEVNGSKSVSPKAEQPQAVGPLPSPTALQPEVQVQVQPAQAQAPPQALTPPVSSKKKEKKKQKAEAGEEPVRRMYSFSISVDFGSPSYFP